MWIAMAIDRLNSMLRDAFPDAVEVDVLDRTGTGDHFHVLVVDASFTALPLLDQHRAVNDALAAALADGTIHELRITTRGVT